MNQFTKRLMKQTIGAGTIDELGSNLILRHQVCCKQAKIGVQS